MKLFKTNGKTTEPIDETWDISEYELENILISENLLLNPEIFGEELLCISNQVTTRQNKRADILSVDDQGRGVIIELKRDGATLGVDMQALQYLASFSKFRGQSFVQKYGKLLNERVQDLDEDRYESGREALEAFTDSNTEKLNQESRIILIAQSFDRSLFSMGSWLAEQGIAFQCIEYRPVQIAGKKLLHFSSAFEQSPRNFYDMDLTAQRREPNVFWHNIGIKDHRQQSWWDHMRSEGFIAANFENARRDKGWEILHSYVNGDKIIAYASSGPGALGYGIIENPEYDLIEEGSAWDYLDGGQRHRLTIHWKATADSIEDGIPAAELKDNYGIHHPISTKSHIQSGDVDGLIHELDRRFSK